LQHARIHGCNDIDCRIELFFGHPRFPCVRKATLHSGIAEPYHCHGETDEHLLALGEAFDGMRVSIENSEICFLQRHCSSVLDIVEILACGAGSKHSEPFFRNLVTRVAYQSVIGRSLARPTGLAAHFPVLSPGGVLRATVPSRHFLGE
jgi:hypothetical protein